MPRCVSWKELSKIIPYCRQHAIRLGDDPKYAHVGFPKRVRLSQCRVCWYLHEIMEWLDTRPRA
jgi:predicted DNA-binding transcriptional regulator AlpA